MDGKGAWRDNVFIERLWRSIKYDGVYLKAYENVPQARAEIGKYLTFYNTKRPHSSLDGQTPDQAYFNRLPPIPAEHNKGRNPLIKQAKPVQKSRATFVRLSKISSDWVVSVSHRNATVFFSQSELI